MPPRNPAGPSVITAVAVADEVATVVTEAVSEAEAMDCPDSRSPTSAIDTEAGYFSSTS